MTIYTIGHSNHPIGTFLAMLTAHGVRLLADVRTLPGSRHNPQYNKEALSASLQEQGLAYRHLPGLGGFRHPKRDSPNSGWKSAGFRGYADYLRTEGFAAALEELFNLASQGPTAIMCAEAAPWRCHRTLIADALTVRGVTVLHIMSSSSIKEHMLTPFAKVSGATIIYPGQ